MTKAALRRIRKEIKIACGKQIAKVARGMMNKTPQKNPSPKGINTQEEEPKTPQTLVGKMLSWGRRLCGLEDNQPSVHTELRKEFAKASARTFDSFSSDVGIPDTRYQNMYSEESAVFEVNDDGGASFTKNLNNYVDANKVPIVYLNASRKRVRRNFNVAPTRFAEIGKIQSPSIFILDNADFIGCEYFLKLIRAVNATRSKLVLISSKTTRTPKPNDALFLLRKLGLKKIVVNNQADAPQPGSIAQTAASAKRQPAQPAPSSQRQPLPNALKISHNSQPLPQVAQPDKPKAPPPSKTPPTPIEAFNVSRLSAPKVAIPTPSPNHTPPPQPDVPSMQQQQRSQLPSTRERQIVNRPTAMNKSSLPAQNNTHPTRPISSSPSIYNREQPRKPVSAIPASRTPQQKQPPQPHPKYVRPTPNPQPRITPPSTTNYPKPQQNTSPTDKSAPTKSIPPTIPEPEEEPPRQTISWDIDL